MSVHLSMTMSEDLYCVIRANIAMRPLDDKISMDDLFKKALLLYVHAKEASARGLKLAFGDPPSGAIAQEVIGL